MRKKLNIQKDVVSRSEIERSTLSVALPSDTDQSEQITEYVKKDDQSQALQTPETDPKAGFKDPKKGNRKTKGDV